MKNRNRDELRNWIALFALVFLQSVASVTPGSAQSNDDLEALRRLQNLCRIAEGQPTVEVAFAPVRRLAEGDDPLEGTWGYTYETFDHRYANDSYSLDAGDGRIYLVSTLRPPAQGTELPPFLWHVISVPTQNPDGVGFIARHDTLYAREDDVITADRYANLLRSTLTTEGQSLLFYVRPELLERTQETALQTVTEAWQLTLGAAMRNLRLTGRPDDRVYTHTFIYVDAPKEVDDINRDTGDRRVSSKSVVIGGTAFGFVLDDQGEECLASTTLSLVP